MSTLTDSVTGAWRRFAVYRREWQPVMLSSGVGQRYGHREFLPRMGKVKRRNGKDVVCVRLLPRQNIAQFQSAAQQVAKGFGWAGCEVVESRPVWVVRAWRSMTYRTSAEVELRFTNVAPKPAREKRVKLATKSTATPSKTSVVAGKVATDQKPASVPVLKSVQGKASPVQGARLEKASGAKSVPGKGGKAMQLYGIDVLQALSSGRLDNSAEEEALAILKGWRDSSENAYALIEGVHHEMAEIPDDTAREYSVKAMHALEEFAVWVMWMERRVLRATSYS